MRSLIGRAANRRKIRRSNTVLALRCGYCGCTRARKRGRRMAVRERPKGSGHYMYDFRISGRRCRGSIPEARTKAQAKQAEAKIRTEIFEGRYGRRVSTMSFAKMDRIVECVPNFSEGRKAEVVVRLAETVESVEGALVLGTHVDPDHNRSVVTFVAPPEVIVEAAVRVV